MQTSHDLAELTLDSRLRDLAADRGSDTFIVHDDGTSTTYAEFDAAANRMARQLTELDVQVGESVGVLSTTTLSILTLLYGIHRVGAVAAMVNPASIEREIAVVLRKSGAKLLIVDTKSGLSIGESLPSAPGVKVLTMVDFRAAAKTLSPDALTWTTSQDDPATMIFTSGTTSEPKAVVYTHGHQLHGAINYVANMAVRSDDVYMHHFPIFHMNGLNQFGAALHAGSQLLLVPRFRSSTFDDLVDRFHPTVTFLNGTHIKMLHALDIALQAPSSLQRVGMSLQMGDDDYDWFEEKYHAVLVEGYGLTESVAMCLTNPLDGVRKRHSCGLPTGTYSIRVVDTDGADCPADSAGELWVKSSSPNGVMHGYAGDAHATKEALAGGWLHTGDIVYRDKDGYVFYVEREKDLIKRAGENISASEVREIIEQLDGVEEAAVIGRPDPLREELPVAFVTLNEGATVTAEQVIEHCRANLAAFKVPVEVRVVCSFPRTAVGKIERRTLQTWLTD